MVVVDVVDLPTPSVPAADEPLDDVAPMKPLSEVEEQHIPSAHRRIRDDVVWMKGNVEDIDVTQVENLQNQFKHISSILSSVRYIEQDLVDVSRHKPIDIPSDIENCRLYLLRVVSFERLEVVLERYLSFDLANDPGKLSVLPTCTKELRTQCVRLLLRVMSCVSDITNITMQNSIERCVSCVGSSAINESACIVLVRMSEQRRRKGNRVKALANTQSLMKLMESALHLVSGENDELTSLVKQALVLVWMLLIGDRERAEEDEIDIIAVTTSLISPYMSGPTVSEWYIGVMALNYLWLADRRAVKDYVFMADMASILLGLCAGTTMGEPRLQGAALSLVIGLVEFNEIRMLMIQNGIADILTSTCLVQHNDIKVKAKVAACLSRLSLHDEATRLSIFDSFEFFDITKEILIVLNPEDLGSHEKDELTQLVLEVVFFLSIHASFKAQLVTALAPIGEDQVIRTEDRKAMLKAPMLVESLPKFGLAAVKSNNTLCQYTYCGIVNNLTRSSEDKEKIKRVPGMPNWDDTQLEQVQVMMEGLPDNAKPVSNGKFDRGDDSLIAEMVNTLITSGAFSHICSILVSSKCTPAMAASGASAIKRCIEKQSQMSNRALMVKIGGFSALLNACSILQGDSEWNSTAVDELRLVRQSLAQLAISVNPKAMSYKESLSLVPQMMHLLTDRHQLFNYEGLLVLTNISSGSEEVRDRIFYSKDGWQAVVNCAFEDNDQLRAAAVELMANMSLCDKLLDRFAEGKYLNDIQFLMASCQEVTNDRCLHAAAGALAMMTKDGRVGMMILERLPNLDTVFEVLQICVAKNDPALLVRIAVFMRNLVEAGTEQFSTDGTERKERPDLVKQWQTVSPVLEFVLNVLSKDLNSLVQNPQVRQSFKLMQTGFIDALKKQRQSN